jgi:hypothetical protein
LKLKKLSTKKDKKNLKLLRLKKQQKKLLKKPLKRQNNKVLHLLRKKDVKDSIKKETIEEDIID